MYLASLSQVVEPLFVYIMIGDPEFVLLKYQSWLDTAKFENKVFGSIVKEYLRPTNNYVPGMNLAMKGAVE